MMYSEFVENTGCRENEHNCKLFERLEAMYMNTDITKAEIYEYGKALMNNELSEKQKAHNEQMRQEIQELTNELEQAKAWKARDMEYAKNAEDRESRQFWHQSINADISYIKELRWKIAIRKDAIIK